MKSTYNLNGAANKLHIPVSALTEHISVFIHEYNENKEKISDDIIQNEHDKIYFQFHRLKSTFKMISAEKAVKICQKACNKAVNKKDIAYIELFNQLSDEITNIEIVINKTKTSLF